MSCFQNLFINTKYSKNVNTVLNSHKNEIICSITICRHPIRLFTNGDVNNVLTTAAKILYHKTDHDMKLLGLKKIYHVYLKIETVSVPESLTSLPRSSMFTVEKLEEIILNDNPIFTTDTEYMKINIIPSNLTIETLLNFTQVYMGNFNYFNYNAFNNNCQDFVIACLKANNLHDSLYHDYVIQNFEPIYNKVEDNTCVVLDDMVVLKDKVLESIPI